MKKFFKNYQIQFIRKSNRIYNYNKMNKKLINNKNKLKKTSNKIFKNTNFLAI
jgi:hypothetical protein